MEWRQIIRRNFIEKKKKERNFFLFKESENALSQTENMQWTYHYDKNELKKKNNLDATNSPTNTYKKWKVHDFRDEHIALSMSHSRSKAKLIN